jgi:hypothetical protein
VGVDIGGESGVLLIVEVYQQLPTLTSNINNNPLSTTNSHLQFQQQQTLLTSNIKHDPRSPMISTTTHSHLQYIQQTTLTSNINNNPLASTENNGIFLVTVEAKQNMTIRQVNTTHKEKD